MMSTPSIQCRGCGSQVLYAGVGGCSTPESARWWRDGQDWAVARWRGPDGSDAERRCRAQDLYCQECHAQVLPPSRAGSVPPLWPEAAVLPLGA